MINALFYLSIHVGGRINLVYRKIIVNFTPLQNQNPRPFHHSRSFKDTDLGTNRKLVVDFLRVIIEHFPLSLTVEALRANTSKSAFVEGGGPL